MKLIADSGSTKTAWAYDSPNATTFLSSSGLHPLFTDATQWQDLLKSTFTENVKNEITEIYFYGTGCIGKNIDLVNTQLQLFFTNASKIEIASDLLGAARGLLGNQPGCIVILGTGSNSAIYDGEKFTSQIPTLGYQLGDEGSGSYIGKKLLTYYLRNQMPLELEICLQDSIDKNNVLACLQQLYSSPQPARWLGAIAKQFENHIEHPFIKQVVKDGFREFFRNIISKYSNIKNYPIACTGSVAHIFKTELEQVCDQFQLKLILIEPNPIKGLIQYHFV